VVVRVVLTDIPAGLDDSPTVLRELFDKASSDPLRTANDHRHFGGIVLFHFDSPFRSIRLIGRMHGSVVRVCAADRSLHGLSS
jgi:hypothetical protein